MVDFEVQDIMKQAQAKGRQGGQQFMIEKFYPMAKAGKRPGGKSAILYFWVFALRGAKSANDVKTFETGLQILKTHYGTGRYARMIQKMQQDLNQMKGGGGD